MAEEKDDFLDQVLAMADRLGLTDDEEKGRYVHEHMTRAGYTMVPSYVKKDAGGGDDTGGFFKNKTSGGKSDGKRGAGWFPG